MTSGEILNCLQVVEAERKRRRATPGLSARVDSIKLFQQQRFAVTYADLLASDRYAPAAMFFLEELYGPGDFARRDAQFARVVPAMLRLFPASMVDSVAALAELHALSETLDTAMGEQVRAPLDSTSYAAAWRCCGNREGRGRQISLTISLGRALDQLTRKALLRKSLGLMRGVATKAGLGEIQSLLERGFDAFAAMGGAEEFLALVESRERLLAERLFSLTADREWINSP